LTAPPGHHECAPHLPFLKFALVMSCAVAIFRIPFMKADIHPKNYRPVIFRDTSTGQAFLTKSCVNTNQTAKWEDGSEYPLYLMGISSFSHPFYTGQQTFVDTAGRVDKFQQRMAKTQAAQEAAAAAAATKKKKK
jgi:large subunit ribosomal protein L31